MVRSGSPKDEMRLTSHLPPSRLQGKRIVGGVDAMDLGTIPILYIGEFMKSEVLPEELLKKVRHML